jgi:hypothetical protein
MVLLVPRRGCLAARGTVLVRRRKQEVRTLMTVAVTGFARIQKFIVPTSVVSG